MPDNVNESASETPSATPETTEKPCCTRGSCCKPHTSAIIAVIALILAGYAAYASSSGNDDSAVYARLDKLDSQIAALSEQTSTLKDEVKSNRENLIQTKLKKALQSIQEIGNLAGEGTKAAISEVENMLKTLTAISDQLATPAPTETTPPASTEPATEPVTEPAVEPETAPETVVPAETAQPEPTPSESTPSESTQAEPAAAPEQPAAAESAATTPDSSAADQTPATTETSPAKTPAKDQTATTMPAAEPSAPQAF